MDTEQSLYLKLKEKLPEKFETACLIAAYNNAIPEGNVTALKDLCKEIQFGHTDDSIQPFKRHRLYPKVTCDVTDANYNRFSVAEAAYFKMLNLGRDQNLPGSNQSEDMIRSKVTRIDFIENKSLELKFLKQKVELARLRAPVEEKLMFHGTDMENISSILSNNFSPTAEPRYREKKAIYGKGIYFSHYPAVSLAYGVLLLCRVLPGRTEELQAGVTDFGKKSQIGAKFHSRRILDPTWGVNTEHSVIHIIKNVSQILPHCVIYLDDSRPDSQSSPTKSVKPSPRATPTASASTSAAPPSPPPTTLVASASSSPSSASSTTSGTSSPPTPRRRRRSSSSGSSSSSNASPASATSTSGSTLPTTSRKRQRSKSPDLLSAFGVVSNKASQKISMCCICQQSMRSDLFILNQCNHEMHRTCAKQLLLSQSWKTYFKCPYCRNFQGSIQGNQPEGKMEVDTLRTSLPGHPNVDTYVISYHFEPGIQGPDHPSPGQPYACEGFPRKAFLPASREGTEILELFKIAFERRLIFTIGTSVTTGSNNVVVWSGILHKTVMNSKPGPYSYPDQNYFPTVLRQLEEFGITKKLLP